MPSSGPRPYTVVRLLGTGGMAQVFEAVAEGAGGFRRRVALKRILPDHQADESVRRSFFDEARIVSHLHHGGIVSVLDYGIADGVPFQILEIVDGADARSLAQSGRKKGLPLPPALALHICREVAHALHYAHEARGEDGHPLGLVHRDIKPANILLSWSGDVKLGDFGIAFASVRTELTIDGTAKGTPPYMSPEQSRGDDVDARSDLYSLGCALHALLCGKSPLAAQPALVRVLRGEDAPLDPDLPEDVRDIVARATHTDRDARYRTAAEMAEDLGRAAARRLEREAKTELIAWIAAVRPSAAPVKATGQLDALLGAELLVSGPAHEGTFRRTDRAPAAALNALLLPDAALAEVPALRADPTVRLPAPGSDSGFPAVADSAPSSAGDSAPSSAGDSASSVAGDSAPSSAGDSASSVAGDSAPSTASDSASPAVGDSAPANTGDPATLRALDTAPPAPAGGGPAAFGVASRRRRITLLGGASLAVLGIGAALWVGFGGGAPGVQAAATGHDRTAGASSIPPGQASSAGGAPASPGTALVDAPPGGATAPPPEITGAPPSTSTSRLGASARPSTPLVPTTAAAAAAANSTSPSSSSTAAAPGNSTAQPAAAAPSDLGVTGTLAVGGPVGATVRVDGVPRGLTPKYIPLPLGSHRVEVVSSDGARLGATVVTLKPEHTASSPLRWSPPKP